MQSVVTGSDLRSRSWRAPFIGVVLALLVCTTFQVFDFTFREPYLGINRRDVYIQIMLGSALGLLWLQLGIFSVWAAFSRRFSRPVGWIIGMLSILGIYFIAACQVQYLDDVIRFATSTRR